jgi:hypothetical protein
MYDIIGPVILWRLFCQRAFCEDSFFLFFYYAISKHIETLFYISLDGVPFWWIAGIFTTVLIQTRVTWSRIPRASFRRIQAGIPKTAMAWIPFPFPVSSGRLATGKDSDAKPGISATVLIPTRAQFFRIPASSEGHLRT